MCEIKLLAEESCFDYKSGRHTYSVGLPAVWDDKTAGITLSIGAFCSIGERVQIFLGGEHNTKWVTTYPFNAFGERWPKAIGIEGHPRTKGSVEIGNDVWIGKEAIILSGVRIGDGAVIGIRSVVTKDVPEYCIYAGNPATFVRGRFDKCTVGRLLRLRWWDWGDGRIGKAVPLLQSDRIGAFIDAAERGEI